MLKKGKFIHVAICVAVLCIIGIWGIIALNGKTNEHSESANSKSGERKIALVEAGFADEIKHYTQEDIENEAELIIQGETVDYKSYMAGPENIWTIEYVKVTECVRGNVSIGDIIEVDRMGGYVLVKDYIDAYAEVDRDIMMKARFTQYSDEEINSEYVVQTMGDDTEVAIGKESIFYLESNKDMLYTRVAERQGETLIAEGDQNIWPGEFIKEYESMLAEREYSPVSISEQPTKDDSNGLDDNDQLMFPTPQITILPIVSITPQVID